LWIGAECFSLTARGDPPINGSSLDLELLLYFLIVTHGVFGSDWERWPVKSDDVGCTIAEVLYGASTYGPRTDAGILPARQGGGMG
ncbi:2738_t:CDS:2, partial [Acaulospora colombiana]